MSKVLRPAFAAAAFPGEDLATVERESHHLKVALGRMKDLQLRGASGQSVTRARQKLELAIARWRGERRTLLRQVDRSPVAHPPGRGDARRGLQTPADAARRRRLMTVVLTG